MENKAVEKREEEQSHNTYSGQSPGESGKAFSQIPVINLPVNHIIVDHTLQSRAATNDEAVASYAELIKDGHIFPPVVVFQVDGTYLLADGFHRYLAHKKEDKLEIAAEVHVGTRRQATLFSLKANTRHGLHRSNADKRKSVELVLNDPEWGQWPSGEIAKLCGVSDKFVGNMKAERKTLNGSELSDEVVMVLRNDKRVAMNVSKIGSKTKKPPASESLDEIHAQLTESLADFVNTLAHDPTGKLEDTHSEIRILCKDLEQFRQATKINLTGSKP